MRIDKTKLGVTPDALMEELDEYVAIPEEYDNAIQEDLKDVIPEPTVQKPVQTKGSFADLLRNKNAENNNQIESVKQQILKEVEENNVTEFALPTSTKDFVVEALKNEGVTVEGYVVKW